MWSQKNTHEIHHHVERVHRGSYTTLHVRKLQLLGRSQVDFCFSKGRALRGFQGWWFRIAELKDPLLKMTQVRWTQTPAEQQRRWINRFTELFIAFGSSSSQGNRFRPKWHWQWQWPSVSAPQRHQRPFCPQQKKTVFLSWNPGLDFWVPEKTSKLTRWAPTR